MQKTNETKPTSKKKLVLRKESIRAMDHVNLALVMGGDTTTSVPPDTGHPTQT
jgi:hypothetical protein